LDKKLLQIASWFFAKNDQPVAQRFFAQINKVKRLIFLKWGEIGVFQFFLVHFLADVGFRANSGGWRVGLQKMGKLGKIKTSKK